MKIIDRYIIKSFLASTLLWLVIAMSLRVVIDLFLNMDEFAELEVGFAKTMWMVGSYYAYQCLVYLGELGGIIILLGAVTTLYFMNRSNELVALLASGVSLHRVVWPLVITAMALSSVLIVNQEMLIPRYAELLVRNPDEWVEAKGFNVRLLADGQNTIYYAEWFDPAAVLMQVPQVIERQGNGALLAWMPGSTAVPGEFQGSRGWSLREGKLLRTGGGAWRNTPNNKRVYTAVSPARLLSLAGEPFDSGRAIRNVWASDRTYSMVIQAERFVPGPYEPNAPARMRGGVLERPNFIFWSELVPGKDGGAFVPPENARVLGIFRADRAAWTPRGREQAESQGREEDQSDDYEVPVDSHWRLDGGDLFVLSDLSPKDLILRKSGRWLSCMSFRQLSELLTLERVPDRDGVELTRHSRVTAPISWVVMLLVGLPFILSRERNIKASIGLCMLMVIAFYAFIFVCRFVVPAPVWAAWLPILLFGPVAVVMLDSVKT